MKETQKEKILKYRNLFKDSINSKIRVNYKRTNNNIHTLNGKVIKCRKSSIILLINDEEYVNIGFRNIIGLIFL